MIKLHIDLPNHWAIGGESLWAEPLGNDLYKIENVPFYAYGLNFQDIVLATPEPEDLILIVRKLVEKSGHRTFRVIFKEQVDKIEQEKILDSLRIFGASFERANEHLVAVDLQPDSDYNAVYDQLDVYLEKDDLSFETCEERVEGSFDDISEK